MHWIKENEQVLAACDEEILGKKIVGKKRSITVNESFYKGKKVNKTELIELINQYDNINLVGKNTIKTVKEAGIKLQTINIKNTPHALIFKINT